MVQATTAACQHSIAPDRIQDTHESPGWSSPFLGNDVSESSECEVSGGREFACKALDFGSWSEIAHEEAPGAFGSERSLGQEGTTRVLALPVAF